MTMLWEEADESFTLWLKPAGHPSQSGRRERKKEVSSKRGPALSWFLVLRLRVGGPRRAGGWMEDECVGSGGDGAVSGRQQRQGGLAWPAVTGQVHSKGGRGFPALGWKRGKHLLLLGGSWFSKKFHSPCPAVVHWLRG